MYKTEIPNEYILERPAMYDEYRFRLHLTAVLTIFSFKDIIERKLSLFYSFFKTEEHAEIARDLLQWIIDKEPVRLNNDVIKKRYVKALWEADYFG